MRRYNAEQFRDRLKQLFRILNTDYPDRDPDDIPDLLEFPYVGSGIEIDGFAVSVAQTALWIAESQKMLATRSWKRSRGLLPIFGLG